MGTENTALADRTIYTLIRYAFYDIRPGNGVDPILTVPEPTTGAQPTARHLLLILVTPLNPQ